MKSALIIGAAGQDGSYLVELLLAKGYRVIGSVRSIENVNRSFLGGISNSLELVAWDLASQEKLVDIIEKYRPQEIYNFAAYSSGMGMFDDPVAIGDVNGLAVVRILEAIRKVDVNIRFAQASSREIFGDAVESPQVESTEVNPRSPYGAAKLYADSMIRVYRRRYGLFAVSAILFNHESPRRRLEFVTRKISYEVARIKLGMSSELRLGNLDAVRDWGFAGDYVRAMWLMLQRTQPSDYVIATGEAHSVRQFCELAFGHLQLDYQDYVREDGSAYRELESAALVGSPLKAKNELNWYPSVSFEELVYMMVDADMQHLRRKN